MEEDLAIARGVRARAMAQVVNAFVEMAMSSQEAGSALS